MSDCILLEMAGAVATLTLNRPEALNTLDLAMMRRLVEHASDIASDPGVRCVVVRGAGKHFMAGGDLRTFAAHLAGAPAEREAWFTRMVQELHASIEHLQRLPVPVIASVHGAVAGFGLSLLAACDLAIAADDAYFTSAYRNIALSPDGGGTYTLPKIVGMKKAMEILLLGRRFDATEALRLGLVNQVVPAGEIDRATDEMVQAIVSGPAVALRNIKRLLLQSPSSTLSEQLRAEAISFGQCTASPDFVEGINAFLGKREPRFN
ncbi:MAG: enoyl-CoA hydratase [Pseudomonadota bacterium]|nr:enoyl-CoA hydratase [Pseudomonadota bacterium]